MFGIWGHEQAAELTYYGLHAQQHRGQDGAGLVTNNGETLRIYKDHGLVNDVFKKVNFEKMSGLAAIGNIRNASQDDGSDQNVQPFLFKSQTDSLAVAHQGNVVNGHHIRGDLERKGAILQTTSDAETLAHLVKRNRAHMDSFQQGLIEALKSLTGAYGFLILTEHALYVASDPHGVYPLSIGRLKDAYVIASETCAFQMIGATYERDLIPGECLKIDKSGIRSTQFLPAQPRKLCAMEYIYYSRPDSDLNRENVHAARKRMGIELAKEAPIVADVVTGVPDSSISAAIGYAEQSGLPYEMGIIKNRYIGRTFIRPSQALREQGVKLKLSPVHGIVKGKKVVMIDDSLVRGTTCRRIVRLLKEAGAKEVHVRIASPRIEYPCCYEVNKVSRSELIAANHTTDDIADIIGADSLAFLSLEGLEKAIIRKKGEGKGICHSCFTGQYPFAIDGDEETSLNGQGVKRYV